MPTGSPGTAPQNTTADVAASALIVVSLGWFPGREDSVLRRWQRLTWTTDVQESVAAPPDTMALNGSDIVRVTAHRRRDLFPDWQPLP